MNTGTTPQARLYARVADSTARMVMNRYSTSFTLACRLLARPVRRDVQNIYALVRIADEIVDGAGSGSGAEAARVRACLDEFERETEAAMISGYSANLVIHAFALSARRVGITTELTRPFFASMRTDLTREAHSGQSLDEYIYGSAEVVGLMCLQAFLLGHSVSAEDRRLLTEGARRLGAAFQKVNFLRDLAQDGAALGRQYIPGLSLERLNEAAKEEVLADIAADLAVAGSTIGMLPSSSRNAVAVAHALFAELAARLERAPVAELAERRIRVPNHTKARLAAVTCYRQTVLLRRAERQPA